MESRFPTMLVSWLGREFYRCKYGMTGSGRQAWSHGLRDKFGDFGDEMWDLKSTGIFLISLLGAEIRIYPEPCDVRACRVDYKLAVLGLLGDWDRLECKRLWNLSLEFYPLCELVSC
ncbi:hypothetical protein AVEN_104077-1 [Araneus ventricosus]|uniref:Uncharacterized protein n=1 Tax=Araneus ventricosus TaxID=182803 RepID=A0A4Y2VGW6_ARAVE|nr:hypothetical protein AVEN_104077-1 [Araneus ventricosus]